MQRQAVPLMVTEAPLVGTGIEHRAAVDTGDVVVSRGAGKVAAAHRWVRVIGLDQNVGFATGCNHGIGVTHSPAVLLLNPLSVLTAGFWLSFGAVAAIFAVLRGGGQLPAWRVAIRIQVAISLALLPLLGMFGLPVSALSLSLICRIPRHRIPFFPTTGSASIPTVPS